MSIEKFTPSYDILKERIEQLKTVVPEAFEDGKVNFATLKETLGEFIEGDTEETEHYSFTWPGKRQARRLAVKPPQGALVPAKGEGINEEKTENIFIEGDNLEVLKLLQKSYRERIKMIYIDPPYNTGNDFIYNDNFTQPLDEYLKLTKQIDEEGNPLVANTRSDGRFHTKWLNMIYPRLKLALNLLQRDGVLFVSIDDNEVATLKKICDEIFGEENFVACLPTVMNLKGNNDEFGFAGTHEYTVVYVKDKSTLDDLGGIALTEEDLAEYSMQDSKGKYKRGATLMRTGEAGAREQRPKGYYPIYVSHDLNRISLKRVNRDDYEIYPKTREGKEMSWRRSPETLEKSLDEFIIVGDGEAISFYKKQRLDDDRARGKKAKSLFYKPEYSSGNGTELIKEMFGDRLFSNPKPLQLIKDFVRIGAPTGGIILDFFAGSGTTAHAVLAQSAEDTTPRNYILVQLPEQFDPKNNAHKLGVKWCTKHEKSLNLAELTKERLRKASKKVAEENPRTAIDLGFKAFKLDRSSFQNWGDYKGTDISELMALFAKQENTLVDGWKSENLLTEILLQEGFPLTCEKTKVSEAKENTVLKISSTQYEHALFVCLDKEIKHTTIKALPLTGKDIFICLDNAITDEDKVKLSDKGLIKTI